METITVKELMDIYDIKRSECVDILSDRTNILDSIQGPISEDFSMEETTELHKAFGIYFKNEMDRLDDYIFKHCEI